MVIESVPSFREFEQQGWERLDVVKNYHQHISTVTTQSADALLDSAGVESGDDVLDVATGAGYVAYQAAKRGANAIGVDFSMAQVQLAKGIYSEVKFEQADAEALPFADDSFDAYVCAFGMCHFPNPEKAMQEAFRLLRCNGRVAFSVWDTPERAVGFGALFSAIREYGSMTTDVPAGPDFFQFSIADNCARVLKQAGFSRFNFVQVPQVWRLSQPGQLFDAVVEGSVRAAAIIRSQTESARAAIRDALREKVQAFQVSDHFEVPMPAVIASAVKL